MKIQLPLENWADLLPSVPRRQLVALLFQLGDRQFASILQYCLNEVGHITLGHLSIAAPRENYAIDGPIVEVWHRLGWESPPAMETILPNEPIPNNVHNFTLLSLSYFDASVLNFLQKFHQHKNALLANAGLHIYIESSVPMEKVQPILTQILPLIGDNIKSLQLIGHHEDKLMCYIRLLYNNQSSGNNDEFSELMTKMLAQVRIISISTSLYDSLDFDWCCRWLYAPRMDGRPRMLSIYLPGQDAMDFVNRIKKDFRMAKHPVTFFIQVRFYYLEFEDICLENAETNENLLVVKKRMPDNDYAFLISRIPKAANAKWIQANEQEILEFGHVNHDRLIHLDISNNVIDT